MFDNTTLQIEDFTENYFIFLFLVQGKKVVQEATKNGTNWKIGKFKTNNNENMKEED